MYKVGVIGLGAIAEGYNQPDDPYPYTHVGGILHSDRVQLVAVADLAEDRRNSFRTKWEAKFPDLRYYAGAEDMLAAEALDIVAVCVRGPHHFRVMQEVLAAGPRAIFLEKPPTCSLEEMDLMVAAARQKSIPITVSYSRHWAPHVLRLQELVQEGLIGEVQMVVGWTGDHVVSYGGHITDLICQFAGYCPTAVYARGRVTEEAPEGYEPEPFLDSMLVEFANGVKGVQLDAPGEHGGFYADVFGTEGMVRAGIYIPPFAKDKTGQEIDLAERGMPPNASVFTVAYDQIAGYLDGGPLPDCTNDNFITVHELGFGAIESILTNQRIELPNQNRSRKVYANG